MKKLFLIISLLLVTLPCYALTYTNTLTNATTADATEVMQNFNDAKTAIESFDASQITDGGITNSKISSSAAIDSSKIEGGTTDVNLQVFASNYQQGCRVVYEAAGNITVTTGEIMINQKLRRNTTATDSAWTAASTTASGLDTGSEASSTTYYVYVAADNPNATTFTVVLSTSSSAPSYSGATNYRLIAQFYNNSSSNIESICERGTNVLKIANGRGTGTGAVQTIAVGFQPVYVEVFLGSAAMNTGDPITRYTVTNDMDTVGDGVVTQVSASDTWVTPAVTLLNFTTTGFDVNLGNTAIYYWVCWGY